MKNYKIFKNILFAVVIFIIGSCSKNETIKHDTVDSNANANVVEQKILNFININNANKLLKNDQKISMEDAVFYIDGTLNYTYCYPEHKLKYCIWDTTNIEIPYSIDNDVLMQDEVSAYNSAVSLVRNMYNKISDTTKTLLCVVVQNMGLDQNSRQIKLRLIAQIGIGKGVVYEPFGENDDWDFRRFTWNCDMTIVDIGGALKIEEAIHANKEVYLPCPNARIWYSSPEVYTPLSTCLRNPFNPFDVVDNYCDYAIFYATSQVAAITDETKCLDDKEMNYYYNGTSKVIYDWQNNTLLNPLGKKFMNCLINGLETTDGTIYKIFHEVNATYGIRHVDCSGSIQYPISIE
ncbi:MAG: hypothetical protein M0R21_01440 [Lentimicrobiaceae bacterium]|nr:hypothetical protein [Lentimicrobiaceae bacterium]